MAAVAASDVIGAAPWSDHDPYTDKALLDPWPGYRQLRDAGPAVWLPQYEMFALTRYDSVRRALENGESFVSRNGVMMNDRMNQVLRGNTLCSDGAEHDALRDVLGRPLTPRALRGRCEVRSRRRPSTWWRNWSRRAASMPRPTWRTTFR
jgi:cytochrome P450